MQVDISPQPQSQRVWKEQLDCGLLRLELEDETRPLEELVGFASRVNPARRYSFVSRVIGKHIPTRPQSLRRIAQQLADRIPHLDGPVLFVGLAEMGVTLGQAVFEAWQERTGAVALYLDSTRVALEDAEFLHFSEEHSHASSHRLHIPRNSEAREIFDNAPSLVLVDDEVTTGRTAKNVVRAISEVRRTALQSTVVASVVSWANPTGMLNLSLATGRMEFVSNGPSIAGLPHSEPIDRVVIPMDRGGSRAGLLAPEELAGDLDVDVILGKNYLVVGTGEFGFLPLKIAEQIEARGGNVFLQSTSRSPLYLGNAIQNLREFESLCGGSWREFLYNVPDAHGYDGVFLCLEKSDQISPDHPLLEIPRLQVVTIPR